MRSMQKKRILTVGPSFASRGGISAVARMLNDLLEAGGNPVDHLGSTVEGSSFGKNLYTLCSYAKFLGKILFRRYLLIHVHSSANNSFYRKVFFVVMSKLARKRVVLHVHPGRFYDFFRSKKRCSRYLIRKILCLPDAVIVLSAGIKEKFQAIIPEEKIFVLNNPVKSFHFRCQREKEEKIILYLGWFVKEKGVFDIVKAVPEVLAEEPTAKFLFCGTRDTEKLRSLFMDKPYKDRVSVREWIQGEEKTDILAQSTMLLLPSYTEGFPNVILEAMASCLPIVTTPVGAIPEALKEGENCLYIQPGDVQSLKEKILNILKNPEWGVKMGEKNLQLVREIYDINIVGSQLKEIYSKVMK